MSEHHPHEALLIRVLDNQSSQAERDQVERLVASDQTAAALFSTLEKTRRPLLHSADTSLPPANPDTIDLINHWQPASHTMPAARKHFGIKSMVATLAFGLIAGHFLTNLTGNTLRGPATVRSVTDTTPEWIQLVADYHRLYTRETIAGTPDQAVSNVASTVSTWLARDTTIPDLSDVGVAFSRAQQLSVDDDMLVQLAYLPATDLPVAVCIRKTGSAKNTDINLASYGGMQYAEWQDGNHAVVVVGDIPAEQLAHIATLVERSLFERT